MTFTDHPRLLARMAGGFYLAITVSAVFAYLYVRARFVHIDNMAQTAADIVAHEQLYRMGFSSALVTVLCNPPMGFLLSELLKVVNRRVALMALVFITVSTTLEAVNLFNYMAPLFTFTLPEYRAAFSPAQLQALARGSIRLWGYGFSLSLAFFGVFCALVGWLVLRSKFLPAVIGVLMMIAGVKYEIDVFSQFLALPDIPYLDSLQITLIGEMSLALWLTAFGVNAAKWQAQAAAARQRDRPALST